MFYGNMYIAILYWTRLGVLFKYKCFYNTAGMNTFISVNPFFLVLTYDLVYF